MPADRFGGDGVRPAAAALVPHDAVAAPEAGHAMPAARGLFGAEHGVLLARTAAHPTGRPGDALAGLARRMVEEHGTLLVVSATRPAPVLRDWFLAAGIDAHDLRFLDCVSLAGGLPAPADGRIMHIPSPGLLELVLLRSQQWLERLHGRRALLVDSVSTLALHNGVAPVEEFVQQLVQRTRRLRAPTSLVLVDRQVAGLAEALRPHVDAVLALDAAVDP